jgi:hypothetical protein
MADFLVLNGYVVTTPDEYNRPKPLSVPDAKK